MKNHYLIFAVYAIFVDYYLSSLAFNFLAFENSFFIITTREVITFTIPPYIINKSTNLAHHIHHLHHPPRLPQDCSHLHHRQVPDLLSHHPPIKIEYHPLQ